MNIMVKKTVYEQDGQSLNFYCETENIFSTDKYNYVEDLLKDFRKKDVKYCTKVSYFELYLDGEWVATLGPNFTADGETFTTWSECYSMCDNDGSLKIADVTVSKHLVADCLKIREVIERSRAETFSK